MAKITLLQTDDWVALYLNNQKIMENHSIALSDFLEYIEKHKLIIENCFLYKYNNKIEKYIEKNHRFPEVLSDIENLLT